MIFLQGRHHFAVRLRPPEGLWADRPVQLPPPGPGAVRAAQEAHGIDGGGAEQSNDGEYIGVGIQEKKAKNKFKRSRRIPKLDFEKA